MLLSTVAAVFFLAASTASTQADIDVDDAKYFSTYEPAGLQSGPDAIGSSFVSAVVYSAADNSVILTGSTWGRYFESREQTLDEDYDMYGSKVENPLIVQGCFLATAALPGSTPEQTFQYQGGPPKSIFWSHRQKIRAPSANEACNALHLFEETSTVVLGGHSEERRNVTINNNEVEEQTLQFGMFLAENWNVMGDKSFKTVGGQMLKEKKTVYPVAMTAPSGNEEDGIFVVFMEANNEAKHIDVAEGQQPHDPATYFDYGAGFGYSVARFDLKTGQISATTTTKTFQQMWLQTYVTEELKSQVYVNGILSLATGLIVMVGTTNGQGSAFGAETDQGSDLDGFLTMISPATGQMIIEPGVPSSYRIQSNNNKHGNDWVTGVCNDPNDSQNHVYIAGTTEGKMAQSKDKVTGTSAFLLKFDVQTMQPIWTKQLGAEQPMRKHKNIARGMACAVTPDGKSVWFGGVVEDGGVIQGSALTKSFGGKDIFVAMIGTDAGDVAMIKQMGTAKDDELALRRGLITDVEGNAILIGNTYGSFYRTRSPAETSSDVFVLTVSLFNGDSAPRPVAGTTSSKQQPSSSSGRSNSGIIILAMSLVAVLAVGSLYVSRKLKGPAVTDRSRVTSYLGRFDIKDVELKHSATGGWHCNFINKLSDGNFVSRNAPTLRPALTAHNSGELPDALMRVSLTVDPSKDLMFCDADDDMDMSSRSTSGLLHGGEPGSVYEDLVVAYNSTWTAGRSRPRTDADNSNNQGTAWGKDII